MKKDRTAFEFKMLSCLQLLCHIHATWPTFRTFRVSSSLYQFLCISTKLTHFLYISTKLTHFLHIIPSREIKWVCYPIRTTQSPEGELKWLFAVTRLTADFTCDLMFTLDIWKQNKKYGHTWHRMSLLRPGIINNRPTNLTSYVQ